MIRDLFPPPPPPQAVGNSWLLGGPSMELWAEGARVGHMSSRRQCRRQLQFFAYPLLFSPQTPINLPCHKPSILQPNTKTNASTASSSSPSLQLHILQYTPQSKRSSRQLLRIAHHEGDVQGRSCSPASRRESRAAAPRWRPASLAHRALSTLVDMPPRAVHQC